MILYRIISAVSIFVSNSIAILNRDLMVIDVNDVLSEKLMPLSFFSMTESNLNKNVSSEQNSDVQLFRSDSFADFDSAFHLMQFHRKMIQNFKCNNYIAKQILKDIVPFTLHDRFGTAANSTGNEMQKLDFVVNIFNLDDLNHMNL